MNKLFYRYYPEDKDPFHISFNETKKYGSGIYFLDNDWLYKNSYDNARLLTVKLNFKNPLVFENHKNQIPCFEYTNMLLPLLKSKKIKNRNELTEMLKSDGYDGMIIHEPRGIYAISFYNNPELFTIISDVGVSSFSSK